MTAAWAALVQVPPVNSMSTGTFNMTCTDTCSWTLTVRGIQDMTMAHIHQGGPTENGPVIVWLVPEEATAPADNSLPELNPPESGDKEFKGTFGNAGLGGPARGMTIAELRSGWASGKMQGYVNVHTTAHPAGEIRGQVMMA
ncbi:hypothetical protein ABPG77_002855 [Micractinium sp. CCAP 211/92]